MDGIKYKFEIHAESNGTSVSKLKTTAIPQLNKTTSQALGKSDKDDSPTDKLQRSISGTPNKLSSNTATNQNQFNRLSSSTPTKNNTQSHLSQEGNYTANIQS